MSAEFRVCTLASGSSGNSLYAESPDGAVLIDAGVSGRKIEEAMLAVGGHVDRVDGLILTHDHTDHSKSAGVISRRHGTPLFMTEGTYAKCRHTMRKVAGPRFFKAGNVLSVGGFHIHTISTPHDGVEPVALILERKGLRAGILTDLGHCFDGLQEMMQSLDVVFLESNYDPEMLRRGSYPPNLKARIVSPHGHISNQEAVDLVSGCDERLQYVVLSHLSENNNTPELALDCMCTAMADRIGQGCLKVAAAPRHAPGESLMVAAR